MKKYTTPARPSPKNEIWEQEIEGQIYLCERPYYLNPVLEAEFFAEGFANESNLLFGRVLPFFFDAEGRWWADPALCSDKLATLCISQPNKYLEAMTHRTQTVKRIIKTLRGILPKLETSDKEILQENFSKLAQCIRDFYSYHFLTFIISDEIVHRFHQCLKQFLSKKECNEYLSEFLQAEITKEALRVGAVREEQQSSRDLFYSEAKPIIFYREPKFIVNSERDNLVIEKLYESNASQEFVQQFFGLRLIAPAVVQINEEAQYVESKMLLPMMKQTLLQIQGLFVQQGILSKQEDIRSLHQRHIEEKLSRISDNTKTKLSLRGLGVSMGMANGKVKIVKDKSDHKNFEEGMILVTELTDPTMVNMMHKAAGIICEIGGMNSHPSIISREMGIPCIVAVKNALNILTDGMVISMNGTTGEIHAGKPIEEQVKEQMKEQVEEQDGSQ